MPYDASNRKDVRAAEKQAKLAEQQRREIVTGIMSVAPGRSWMCDLLEHCHIFHTSYNDLPHRMAFMEGQREVGIRLLSDIMSACPDHYVLMMRERNERNSSYDARRSKPDSNGRDRQPDPNYDSGGDDSTDLYDSDGDTVDREPTR
jgi:hypothetical protein